jgi:hypothetical protein
LWQEHGIVLLVYLGLTIGLTWPLVRDFTTAVTGGGDARHHLWILWHTKQALLGRDPLFRTSLLYYPTGTSLLTHSLGPVAGLFALPFWRWGPEAAYNGAALIGFWLTGVCMYLLARGLGFGRGVALFAGVILLAAPRHLSALYAGHLTKVFLGALPLVLLGLCRALDLQRSDWWAVAPAGALLLALLYSSEQFVFGSIAVGFFIVVALLAAQPSQRWRTLRRCLLIGACALVVVGPMLVAILSAASTPDVTVEVQKQAFIHQPDLIQFFIPASYTSRFIGPLLHSSLAPYVRSGIEAAVFLSWTGVLLCLCALIGGLLVDSGSGLNGYDRKAARHWLLFTLLCAVLALGPKLLVLGETKFTDYELNIVLPYAFVTSLPGLGFLRSPGRFMLIGFVGFGIAASFGLEWLAQRVPGKLRGVVPMIATALVLVECWPGPMRQQKLRPVPQFYQQIAEDDEEYGVFDLPVRPFQELAYASGYKHYSSYYQMYQMTHGKGIATGSISRSYDAHPLFAHFVSNSQNGSALQRDVLVNGEPANRYANVRFELANHGYRYVVYHKPLDWYPDYAQGSWGDLAAQEFIRETFGQQPPLVDDDLVTVYEVGPFVNGSYGPMANTAHLTTTIALRESTQHSAAEAGTGKRWVLSPSTFYVASPDLQLAYLEVTPDTLDDPESKVPPKSGFLSVQSADGVSAGAQIKSNETVTLPVALHPGSQVITLTVESKNSGSPLDFAVRSIDLRTEDPLPFDILVDGRPQQDKRAPGGKIIAAHGVGWYDAEEWDASGATWRWAQSPAQLLVYSPSVQQVRIRSVPGAMYVVGSETGVGDQGVLRVAVGDQVLPAFALQAGQPFAADVTLQAGWSSVTLELEAGSFRPMDVQPGNGDARWLSFALGPIELVTR